MAYHLQAVGVFVGDDGQWRIGLDAITGVDDACLLARADAPGKRGLGQAGPDGSSDISHRGWLGKLPA